MKHRILILGAVASLAGISAASPVQAASAHKPLADSFASSFASSAVSEVLNADGSVTDTWQVAIPGQSSLRVATTGPGNMKVGLSRSRNHLVLSATPPPIAKTPGLRISASPGSIFRSWCIQAWPGRGYIRSCDVQRWAQQNGTDWYLADEQESTGSDPGHINAVIVWVNWSANNQIVHWSPNGEVSTGSCQTTSVSVGWNGSSFSQSWTACPDKYGPYCLSDTCFGAAWLGFASSATRGVGAVDLVHDPPNASPGTTLYEGWSMS